MDQLTEISPALTREIYLSRLPEVDQKNLEEINHQFQKVLSEEGRNGALIVVGGTIDKPLPRKDIDILMILQPYQTDPKKGSLTELDFALNDFQIFQELIKKIISNQDLWQIKQIYPPAMDEEFESPNILKHDGSIIVANDAKDSLPIEFVRIGNRGSYQQVLSNSKRPFVVLKEV